MPSQFPRKTKLDLYTNDKVTSIDGDKFDFTFDINLTSEKDPNSAMISIFGLDENNRNLFSEQHQVIEFYGGHKSNYGLIFRGNTTNVFDDPTGADWKTIVHAGDGFKEYTKTFFDRTYAAGTQAIKIVNDIAKFFGLPLIYTDPSQKLLNSYVTSVTFSGLAQKALNTICRKFNLRWSIQFGVLEIRDSDYPINTTIVTKYEGGTNIIGMPKILKPLDKRNVRRNGLQFTALIDPTVKVGSVVEVISDEFIVQTGDELKKKRQRVAEATGYWLIEEMHIYGSTFDNAYYMDLRGRADVSR